MVSTAQTIMVSSAQIILVLAVAFCFAIFPILVTAWIFSSVFRVKEHLRLVSQIRDELKSLNGHNAGQENVTVRKT